MDPVLEQHLIMSGAGVMPPPVETSGFPAMPMMNEQFSRKLPIFVGIALLGAIGGLFLFKLGGFRFVFGARVGTA